MTHKTTCSKFLFSSLLCYGICWSAGVGGSMTTFHTTPAEGLVPLPPTPSPPSADQLWILGRGRFKLQSVLVFTHLQKKKPLPLRIGIGMLRMCSMPNLCTRRHSLPRSWKDDYWFSQWLTKNAVRNALVGALLCCWFWDEQTFSTDQRKK